MMNDQDVTLDDLQMMARQESAKMHHYFVGVEHLFVAMTRLDGGLTTAVLEDQGISPRFVRYSIRETVGQYENRRYWPGFPETPRATTVLNLAAQRAGENPVTERDLLLAIFEENDSIVIRVLAEIGADLPELRETAENWTSPLRRQPREVPIRGDARLDAEETMLLQAMFRDYSEIVILREFDSGRSGARVFLVHPVRFDGHHDTPVVVKLDDRQTILYERRRYDLHVKGTLPAAAARLLDSPVAPDQSRRGGLKYTFVGRIEDTAPLSLLDVALREPHKLGGMIRTLFEEFGPTWWQQRQPYHFHVWREYEHILPPALFVDALPQGLLGATGHELSPLGMWSRNNQVLPGEVVELNSFVVQKLDYERDILHLAAGSQPEAINRASKVEVRGLGLGQRSHFRGELVESLVGRVVSTRDDLLRRSLQALEPNFDLRLDRIPSDQDDMPDLPNPLFEVNALLDRQLNGSLSVIHGDLHLRNILVGPRGDAWLIDFAWTREGHTLFDWVMLETSLLVEAAARLVPPGWEHVWGIVKMLARLNRGDENVLRDNQPLGRVLAAVKALRDMAQDHLLGSERWNEYYIALALMGLRMMDWQSESMNGRRLAFLSSALSLAAVQSPQDILTRSDQNWMETTTDAKSDLSEAGRPTGVIPTSWDSSENNAPR